MDQLKEEDYIIITGTSIDQLREGVNKYIAQNYKTLGGLAIIPIDSNNQIFCQAMLIRDK